jgi:hypothetical protein
MESDFARPNAIKRPSKKQKQERTLKGMKESRIPGFAFIPSPVKGEGHCNSNYKHEERLNKIPETKAIPFMMMKLVSYKRDNGSIKSRID